MTISLCMGIYNGEKYIEEQLNSILRQTRKADEVILCDDGSTDGTVEAVRGFIERNGLGDNWKLYCNQKNRGYPGNFYYAMSLCTMDAVFLADQDDIWAATKLERMCNVLEQHPEAKLAACKFGLIDSADEKIHALMSPSHSLGTGKLQQIGLFDIFYKYEWPGMVLAYRNAWYLEWEKRHGGHENLQIPHDIFLCAMAAEEGAFLQLDAELAYHRRHEDNTAAEEHRIGKLLQKDRKLWEIEKYLRMLQEFEKCQVLQTAEGKRILRGKIHAMEGRYEALQSGKISQVLRRAFRDRRYVRIATVVCDLLIVGGW